MDSEQIIHLGYNGDYNARSVSIDISELRALCPDGVPVLMAQRRGEKGFYLPAGTEVDGSTLVWTFDAHDTQVWGRGKAQIKMVDAAGNILAHSPVFGTFVHSSIDGAADAPPWWDTWEQRIVAMVATVQQDAAAAKEAAGNAYNYADAAEKSAQEAAASAAGVETSANIATDAAEQASAAVEAAAAVVQAASDAAGSALGAAGAAEDAASQASEKAGEAATSASQAGVKAGEAATSASQAMQAASEAAASQDAAAKSAQAAADAANGIVVSDNLFEGIESTSGIYIDDYGNQQAVSVFRTSDFIAVKPGVMIYLSGDVGVSAASTFRRVHAFDADGSWIEQVIRDPVAIGAVSYSGSGVLPANAAFVKVCWRDRDKNIVLKTDISPVNALVKVVGAIKDDIASLQNTTETPAEAGKVWTTTADGAEWKTPTGGGNVKINGVETTDNNIPLASNNAYGVFKTGGTTYANRDIGGGVLASISRTAEQYKTDSAYMFISKGTLNNVLATPSIMPALTAEEQQAAQERIGLGWYTVTITEADFPVVSSGYSVYKIVPPDGYRFDEVQFLLQFARSTAGSAQAALNIGIHDTITDSGFHSVNQNIPAANLFIQCGGRITCLSDYDSLFNGTAASGTTVYESLPVITNIGSALSRTLHCDTRPSRTLSIGLGSSFAIEHAYGVIKYRLVKAD